MSFARHSSLTDLTQRSAYEFRFGLLAGRRIGFTLADSISLERIRRTSYLGHAANSGSLSGIPTAPWSGFAPAAPSTPDPGTARILPGSLGESPSGCTTAH